jgi:hypothetical protein
MATASPTRSLRHERAKFLRCSRFPLCPHIENLVRLSAVFDVPPVTMGFVRVICRRHRRQASRAFGISIRFPVFFPDSREFAAENGSHRTVPSAIKSCLFSLLLDYREMRPFRADSTKLLGGLPCHLQSSFRKSRKLLRFLSGANQAVPFLYCRAIARPVEFGSVCRASEYDFR